MKSSRDFGKTDYDSVRAKLKVDGRRLLSLVNEASYGIGYLEVVSLQALRERAEAPGGTAGRLKVGVVVGDVRRIVIWRRDERRPDTAVTPQASEHHE